MQKLLQDQEFVSAVRPVLAVSLGIFCVRCLPMIFKIAVSHKHGLYQPACVGSYLVFVSITVWLWRGTLQQFIERRKAR